MFLYSLHCFSPHNQAVHNVTYVQFNGVSHIYELAGGSHQYKLVDGVEVSMETKARHETAILKGDLALAAPLPEGQLSLELQ